MKLHILGCFVVILLLTNFSKADTFIWDVRGLRKFFLKIGVSESHLSRIFEIQNPDALGHWKDCFNDVEKLEIDISEKAVAILYLCALGAAQIKKADCDNEEEICDNEKEIKTTINERLGSFNALVLEKHGLMMEELAYLYVAVLRTINGTENETLRIPDSTFRRERARSCNDLPKPEEMDPSSRLPSSPINSNVDSIECVHCGKSPTRIRVSSF